MTKIFSRFGIRHWSLIGLIRIIRSIRHFKYCFICLSVFWFFGFSVAASAATLYFLPASNEIPVDETFIVEARIDTENQSVNTIDAKIIYPKEILEIMDISNGGSVISIWPQAPKMSNGEIVFTGGIPNGFVGDKKIFSVIFKNKKTGNAALLWSQTSKILLNDGAGTEAEKNFLEGNYKIVAKKELLEINSPDHPDQNKWYATRIVELNWKQIPGMAYSYIVSKDPLAEPDDMPDFITSEGLPAEASAKAGIELSGLENGVYYFHLKLVTPKPGEGGTFRIMIDDEKPEITEAKADNDPSIFDNQYFLSFVAKDNVSGIDKILVAEVSKNGITDWQNAATPYLLNDQSRKNEIKIKAIDKAGNETIYTIPPIKLFPYRILYIIIPFIIILIALIILIILKKTKRPLLYDKTSN